MQQCNQSHWRVFAAARLCCVPVCLLPPPRPPPPLLPLLQNRVDVLCLFHVLLLLMPLLCWALISTNIHYLLQNLGVKQLILVGCVTDQCVAHAVKDACDLGYLVTLLTGGRCCWCTRTADAAAAGCTEAAGQTVVWWGVYMHVCTHSGPGTSEADALLTPLLCLLPRRPCRRLLCYVQR